MLHSYIEVLLSLHLKQQYKLLGLAQVACIAALNEGLEAPQYMNEAYIERKNYLVSELESLGFELKAKPEGAFYIFPDISKFTNDDFDLGTMAKCASSSSLTQKSKSSFVNFEISGKM